jgi:cellobiose-specific phosphotransferase system component IIA
MDKLEDTTWNNLCTFKPSSSSSKLSAHLPQVLKKKNNVGKKNSKSLKTNMFHMEDKLMTNVVIIELQTILY